MFNETEAGDKLIFDIMEHFPYPLQLYEPNGDLIMVNQAFLDEFNIKDAGLVIRKYNLLKDPVAMKEPFYQKIIDSFSGSTTQSSDIIIPVHIIKETNNIQTDADESVAADISTIPVVNDQGILIYVLNLLVIKRRVCRRKEIDIAKAYIETHWSEQFKIEDAAKEVHLSTSYFSRIFKTETGFTPHEYYLNIKIEKIKDKLLDFDLSIEEAFFECGVNYHGYFAGLFRRKTGFSPSEYRKLARK